MDKYDDDDDDMSSQVLLRTYSNFFLTDRLIHSDTCIHTHTHVFACVSMSSSRALLRPKRTILRHTCTSYQACSTEAVVSKNWFLICLNEYWVHVSCSKSRLCVLLIVMISKYKYYHRSITILSLFFSLIIIIFSSWQRKMQTMSWERIVLGNRSAPGSIWVCHILGEGAIRHVVGEDIAARISEASSSKVERC